MNNYHFIYNAHYLLSAALIKDLVGCPIALVLLPKVFMKPSMNDPCIPWWHHAQCGGLQHMGRHGQYLLLKWGTSQYLLGRESHVHILGSNLGK